MARYNKKQTDLLRRLDKVSGRILQRISRQTSLFSYQRGYTKYGLQRVIKSTKNRNVLKALDDVVKIYEQFGTSTGLKDTIHYIYTTSNYDIQRFIRVMHDRGWTDEQILIALENSYDYIMAKGSDVFYLYDDDNFEFLFGKSTDIDDEE